MGKLIERLHERFGDRILEAEERHGEETIVVPREDMTGIFQTLRDDSDFQFGFLMDYTAVDYLGRRPRFDLVAHLFSLSRLHRLRVKARVDESDCRAPSLTPVWKAADWLEREIWDMFGIHFDGHPDLRRILMYPEFEGYPLRKDYPVLKRQPIIPERDPVENPWPSRSTRLRG